ncbi:MAG: RluA family pseudouridine synthase [Micrococcales bacterium]|nr:RluA family pseudouridine synthase [Micrococcales bacterium]MCL2667378.1 RluA family pseudouridine synthase [Micrococcales bacterium]
MAERRELPVPDGLAGERVDVGLARLLGLSRARSALLAGDGQVTMDGRTVGKGERLVAGAWLEVTLPPPPPVVPSSPDGPVPGLVVVHEDADVVVVDKPVGVAAHPSPGWTGATVVSGLAAAGVQVALSGPAERPGIVHRLDAGTSGLMVVAKSERAYKALKQAFRERSVDKQYLALVQGYPDPTTGTVDAPIGRLPGNDWKFAVVADGRPSVTHYQLLEAVPSASLLQVQLETGRTHQIRVHMAAIRHPLVGDTTYGADPVQARRLGLTRQWLHAARLSFTHPGTGSVLDLACDPPADLAQALDTLRET